MSLFNMSNKSLSYAFFYSFRWQTATFQKVFTTLHWGQNFVRSWGHEVGRNFGFATFPNGPIRFNMTYWFLTSGNNQRDFVWSLYPMLPHPGRIAVVFDILLSVVCMTRRSIKCYIGFSNSNILLYLRPKIRTNMTVELFLKALRARQYYDVNEVNIYHLLNNW